MICLRCGYCCVKYDTIIINPKYINEKLDFEDPSIEEKILFKEHNKWCPHLTEKKLMYSCKVHDKPWYKDTPCYNHTQIESSDNKKCRIGDYVKGKNKYLKNQIKSLKGL
jgi:hypothetical protein